MNSIKKDIFLICTFNDKIFSVLFWRMSMDQYFELDLFKSGRWMFVGGFEKEIIALLLPYEEYVNDKTKAENSFSYASTLEKDLFYKFIAEDGKEYHEVTDKFSLYYFTLGRCYNILQQYDFAIKYLSKAFKLNPISSTINAELLFAMSKDMNKYPELPSIINNGAKFACEKEILSDRISDYGDYLALNENYEGACCCYKISDEIVHNTYARKHYEKMKLKTDFDKNDSSIYRNELSSKYGFPLGIDIDVMNFIRDLANSELAKNNFIGFTYYATQLASLDNNYIQELDNYNMGRKSKFYASSNPIKTYYGDSKGSNLKLKKPLKDLELGEYLLYELNDYNTLINNGISILRAKKILLKFAFNYYLDDKLSYDKVYYLYQALGVKVPKEIIKEIYSVRHLKNEFSEGIETNLTELQKGYCVTREEAIPRYLLMLLEEYNQNNTALDVITDTITYLGYHYDYHYLLKSKEERAKIGYHLYDDKNDFYEVYFETEDTPVMVKKEVIN